METKRVSDQYKISAPAIIIDGNLTVLGSTTSVETINSTIEDNIIILNQGEDGSGITEGSSGIEVDRGSLDNATLLFDEADDAWEAKVGSSFAILRSALPVGDDDVATKGYVASSVGNVSPAGELASIQYNNGSTFGGSANLLWNGSEILVGQNLTIGANSIGIAAINDDLTLSANGDGKVFLRGPVKLEDITYDPNAETDRNMIYAKQTGNAGSGVYFSNPYATDELVSRSKAILFSLIF